MKTGLTAAVLLLASIVGAAHADGQGVPPPRHGLDDRLLPPVPLAAPSPSPPGGEGKGGGALPRPEQLATFDPMIVQIARQDGHWTVEAGGVVLKDCGRREEEARQVWRLIQQLGVNQPGIIRGRQPVVENWGVNGEPPTILPRGLRAVPFNLAELRLEQSQGCWVLREMTRVLFNFGPEEAEARQALAVLQHYGFNRIGIVGQAIPAMTLLVADP